VAETITQPGGFTVGSSPANQSIIGGTTATYIINVAPNNGAFTGPVILSVAGLPPNATALFSPTSVNVGAGGASSILTIKTVALQAGVRPNRATPGSRFSMAALAMSVLMLPLFRLRSIRNAARKLSGDFVLLFCLALSLGALIGLSGCGGHATQSSTQSPIYTVTVTGISGSLQQSTTITLTVQ
jgi:hypothetical protein